MSEYESLAEQMKSDYQAIMTAFGDMKSSIGTVETRMASVNKIVLRTLSLMEGSRESTPRIRGSER